MTRWLIAILFLQILAIESAGAHSAANLNCLQLLMAKQSDKGIDLMSAQTQSVHISQEGQTFLNLLKVGLDNVSSERPELTRNIQSTLSSPQPVNPFLNLTSPLARALSAKVETLLPQLGDGWPLLKNHLVAQFGEATLTEIVRQKDRGKTRRVRALIPLPGDEVWVANARIPNPLAYLGQTQAAYLFADRSTREEGGRIYRLSKQDQSFVSIAQIPNWFGSSSMFSRWMHNGSIYGWTFFTASSGVITPRIFRLNPESKEVTWAEVWHDRTHIAHRVNATNTVVGFRIDPRLSSGENGPTSVFRLDYDLMRFVPTDLEFDGGTTNLLPDLQPYDSVGFIAGGTYDPPIDLGKGFKTDGRVLVSSSGSGTGIWEKWTPIAIVRTSEVWKQADSLVGITIERCPLGYNTSDSCFEDKEIHFLHQLSSWDNKTRTKASHSFELFDRGAPSPTGQLDSILYLYRTDKMSDHTHLFAIDRKHWQRIPIELIGGPELKQSGKFELVRNQQDEILLQFQSQLRFDTRHFQEVALWKFDPQNLRFDLQAHEVLPAESVPTPGANLLDVLFDYETKQFIAWIFAEGLVVLHDADVSEGEGSR